MDVTLSTSALYELMEWGAAATVGSDLGAAYLGTQGDIWDAQKDMALAAAGAVIAMAVTALVNWRARRDLARDWADSLKPGRQAGG
jgi:putative membrane protein